MAEEAAPRPEAATNYVYDVKVERSYQLSAPILDGLANGLAQSSVRLSFAERWNWQKDGDRLCQVLAASKLVYLELYVCGTMNNMALAKSLAGLSTLRAFRMDDAREVSAGFLAETLACKSLRKISLARCNVRGDGLELFQAAIAGSGLENISLVDVDFGGGASRGRSRSEDAFVLPFLEACLACRSCTLSNIRIADETCHRLADGFASGRFPVEELQISGNTLSPAGRAALEAGAQRAPKATRFCIEGRVVAGAESGAASGTPRMAVSGEGAAGEREGGGPLAAGMLTPLELPAAAALGAGLDEMEGLSDSGPPSGKGRPGSLRGPASPLAALASPASARGRPSPVPRPSPRPADDTAEPPAKRAANGGLDELSDGGGSANGSERSAAGIHKRSPFYNVTPATVLAEDPRGFPRFDIPERYRRHRILKIGELVWGQGGGFPFWPAQVTRMNGVTKDRLYSIQYVDQDRTEQYTSDEMVRFDIGLELFGGMRITNREIADVWTVALGKARKLRQKQPDDPPRRAPSQGLVDKQERLELMHRRKKHLMSSLKHPGRSGRGRARRAAAGSGSGSEGEAGDDGSDVLSVDSFGSASRRASLAGPTTPTGRPRPAAPPRRAARKPRPYGADDEEEGGTGSGAESDGAASQDTLGSLDPTERLVIGGEDEAGDGEGGARRRRPAQRRAAVGSRQLLQRVLATNSLRPERSSSVNSRGSTGEGTGRAGREDGMEVDGSRDGGDEGLADEGHRGPPAGRAGSRKRFKPIGGAASEEEEAGRLGAGSEEEVEDLVAEDEDEEASDEEGPGPAGPRPSTRPGTRPAPKGRRPPRAGRFGQLAALELPGGKEAAEIPAIAKIKREGGASPRSPGSGASPRGASPRGGLQSPRVAALQGAGAGGLQRVGSFHALLEAAELGGPPAPAPDPRPHPPAAPPALLPVALPAPVPAACSAPLPAGMPFAPHAPSGPLAAPVPAL